MKSEHVKLAGMKGTWYVIDEQVSRGTTFYLWEPEQYGDGYPCVLTDGNLTVYDDCCWSGILDALAIHPATGWDCGHLDNAQKWP